MPVGLLALAAGAIGFNVAARSRRDSAFSTALTSFTNDPNAVGPPLPGSESGSMLTPVEAAGLQNLYRVNPLEAITMLNNIQGRKQTAHHNQLTREIQWENVANARNAHAETQRQNRLQQTNFLRDRDSDEIRRKARAADLDAVYVKDHTIIGSPEVRTPAPGGVEWRETLNKSTRTAQAADTLMELLASIGTQGVIRRRDAPGFATQQGLRQRMAGEIKSLLALGALDLGVQLFTSGLIGDAMDQGEFILGDDASTIELLMTTMGLFNNELEIAQEDMRLLQSVNPEVMQLFNQTLERAAAVGPVLGERINLLRSFGGDIEDLQRALADPAFQQRGGGGGLPLEGEAPTMRESALELLNIFGADAVTGVQAGAGLLGARGLLKLLPRAL